MRTDLFNSIDLKRGISPYDHGTGDAAVVSQTIDMQGQDALVFAIATGSLADADATFTVLVEESDDSGMSGATAVADADLLGTESDAGIAAATRVDGSTEKVTKRIGYTGNKRYVQLGIVNTATAGTPVSAEAILHTPEIAPTSNP